VAVHGVAINVGFGAGLAKLTANFVNASPAGKNSGSVVVGALAVIRLVETIAFL
jgi:hypothetical protein